MASLSSIFIASVMICTSSTILVDTESYEELKVRRNAIFREEFQLRTGGDLELNEDEIKVNEFLRKLKEAEYAAALEPNGKFWPSEHFFKARRHIEKSPIFKIIKKMPKGADLHVHSAAMGSPDILIKATYDPKCYMCEDYSGRVFFRSFEEAPESAYHTPDIYHKNMNGNVMTGLTDRLLQKLTILAEEPEAAFPTQQAVWAKFKDALVAVIGLLSYPPVFKAYLYESLQGLVDDNVQYAELRVHTAPIYGTKKQHIDEMMMVVNEVNAAFLQDNPGDFKGIKVIMTSIRTSDKSTILSDIKETLRLKQRYPNLVAGYDIVSHEDTGYSLQYYANELLHPSQSEVHLPYFFHAGETNWYGPNADANILDALLLNASRIGHGFAITKHPMALKMVLEQGTALEVNPISNQVLKYVKDLRNHPATALIAAGFPVVISSDDPGVWGIEGLSYDFYMAYMALGGSTADLRTLKKLAKDSIDYSAMSPEEKESAHDLCSRKWEIFLQQVIEENGL